MIRPLIIDSDARAAVASVLSFAEKNPYTPGPGVEVPGDNPNHVAFIGTYRFVFTYTHADGMVYRHLTASVPGEKYPNPVAVFMVAEMFGFTGWSEEHFSVVPKGWMMDANQEHGFISLAQACRIDAPVEKLH